MTPWTLDHQSFCLWDFPGRKTGVGCHFFLQEIFQTQESNPGLLHWRLILYGLSQQGVTGLFDNKLRLCSNCKISVTMSDILRHNKCSVKDIVWSSTGKRDWAKTIVFFCLFFTFWLQGMWDLSSPTSDQTHASCGLRSLHHWTTRQLPMTDILYDDTRAKLKWWCSLFMSEMGMLSRYPFLCLSLSLSLSLMTVKTNMEVACTG